MFRTLMIGAVSALMLSAAAFAQQGGTEQEARAMLSKAIAAVKADPVVVIAMFIKGGCCTAKATTSGK
jgi:predicted outer membrane protein